MQSLIGDVLESKGCAVHTIERRESAFEAVRVMNERRIGSLVVVDDSKPTGMFTERDVLCRIVSACQPPATTAVDRVMSKQLVSITSDYTVEQTLMLMTSARCRHLPVLDDGCLAGLISIGDLTQWLLREKSHEISQLMEYISAR